VSEGSVGLERGSKGKRNLSLIKTKTSGPARCKTKRGWAEEKAMGNGFRKHLKGAGRKSKEIAKHTPRKKRERSIRIQEIKDGLN